MPRDIGAASACEAGERAPRNAPLAGFRPAVALRCGRVLARRGCQSSLGYEPYDIGLCRLRQSLAGAVTSTDRTDPISLCRVRLLRLKLSRRVRFTNRFTEQAIDLHFPAPSAPFRGYRPWGAALLPASPSDCQAARPRHATRRFRSCPTPGRTAPSRHHRYRVCTGAPTHHCVSRHLPRTRLLPDLTADGFCPGSAQPITQ